jgi:hypothetical protein
MIDCAITEIDCEGNHINVAKVIDIDDELVECLRKGLGKYIITNQSGELYTSSSAFTKLFEKEFNDYTPYCLRRAISSRYIERGNVNEIKK